MKISITVGSLLNDLYADSALHALAAVTSATPRPLNADRRAALRRFIIVAAAEVAASVAGRLLSFSAPSPDGDCDDDAVEFEFGETVAIAEPALSHHLSAAMTFAVLRLVALSCGDYRRAEGYEGCQRSAIEALDQCPRNLRLRPAI